MVKHRSLESMEFFHENYAGNVISIMYLDILSSLLISLLTNRYVLLLLSVGCDCTIMFD